mmetsp:Transcript_2267/g.6773  ORF Transcript_2267/g.6773 Transcript_2267/m.6773 type:complete len:135 (+) Transcript_2267:147-551(+)|eukprot:CAMPEP_0198728150 /NCGR_PEP_ID=MMETSP1475-20131203/7400_1 /TAXON_ID= ORGANISM="Unidentified sp., Strain CCMP1999" /NCGR_SAMPLE_ID=MMETSP1475 /ASSEMBLY_ACC=CAM_ASM_001111 /LENGTH=134 /DNA_ID=CAMNT_0044490431 /DNA_START=78 /DNA_END=482 /DNA_ORIENTATION=+
MAGRILAQLILAGGTFMVRTFAQAYRQALVNAQAGGGAAQRANRVVSRGQMTAEEAAQILGVNKEVKMQQLHQKYQRLYEQNSPNKGGSPYLQYKIIGAKEVLERECISRGEKPPEAPNPKPDGDTDTKRVDGR